MAARGSVRRARGPLWLTLLALGAAAAGLPAPAGAASEARNPHLQRALEQIEQGKIDAAEEALDQAMAWPRNDNRTLVEIYRNLAVVHFYGGKQDEAYEDFARLLNIDLHYELPASTAGPLRELYDRVKAAYDEGLLKPIRVAHDPPMLALPGTPVTMAATISNLKEGFEAFLLHRKLGDDTFVELPLDRRPGNRFSATLPALNLPEGATELVVEYYLEVRDARGRRVQGRGSALSPLSYLIEVPGGGTARWYKNPWLWTAVGVVAVGATAGGIAAARGSRTGTLPLTITVQ
ncbi:MAG: tetratricopeptide repeat protein [Deltaproteobacteria bacterium]|nr:tetratricopeptide repeat protein [Deltaproteobacteria bacterium]